MLLGNIYIVQHIFTGIVLQLFVTITILNLYTNFSLVNAL